MTEGSWLPLTSAQRGLYFAHELDPTGTAYSTAEVVEFDGPIEAGRLAGALRATYAEFEQLRAVFRTRPTGPEQCVVGQPPAELERVRVADAAAAERWLSDRLAIPFDLTEPGPDRRVRTALLELADGRWWFHAAHHVLLDGFGYLQFAARVAEHYRGSPRPLAPAGLADLVAEDAATPQDSAVWLDRLATFTGMASLAQTSAPPAGRAIRAAADLPEPVSASLAQAARRLGCPWTDLVTAACLAYLQRMHGHDAPPARLGVPLMNRTGPGGRRLTATTVCTAMNVLPVAVEAVQGTVGELVAGTSAALRGLKAGAFVRQEELVRLVARNGVPQLFGPMLNLLPLTRALDFGERRGVVRNLCAGPVEDMTWCLRGAPGQRQPVTLEVDANPTLYSPEDTRRHLHRLIGWLERFAGATPDTALRDLSLLDAAEWKLVVEEFNDTTVAYDLRPLPTGFGEQAGRLPEQTALVYRDRSWTYAQLAAAAQRVATELRAAGVRHGDTVAVALPRSLELFAAIYAVHVAGAAYLPLDADLPAARLADMAVDADATVVVTSADSVARMPARLSVVDVATALGDPAGPASTDGSVPPALDDLAYVLFTSGSTGRPKGVGVEHRAIANRLAWMQQRWPLGPGSVVLHKTPVTFDVSVWELFWPLLTGSTIVIAEPDGHRDPRYLAELIRSRLVDTLHFVPSMLAAFVADPHACARLGSSVRRLFCSGEALSAELVARATEVFGVPPINLYGPTEAAVDVTAWECDPARDGAVVPIGGPVANTRAYVLDDTGRPVPVGVTGELYLAGVQLARGYVGRPELTAAAFVADPFVPGQRMYRTGDLACWRADGALLYLGRADGQVKLRGQRLELGEIESVLAAVPGVVSCAVALTGTGGDARLVALYVPDEPGTDLSAALHRSARDYLPGYMVPAGFVAVTELPLTASGKTDRRALAALATTLAPAASDTAVAPRGLTEQRVCEAMSRLVGARVGPEDDFFDAGGHSLLALRLCADLEEIAGRPVGLTEIFAGPSARSLAVRLAGTAGEGSDVAPVIRLRAGAAGVPPLFALPPAGGLGWCYAGLLRHLPPELGVFAVQSAGLDGSGEALPDTLDELARWQLDRIRGVVGRGPFHLIGWSIGGMTAHEIAARALAEGQDVGAVVLLDAYPSEQWRDLAPPSEQETLRAVLRMAGVEHLVAESETLDRDRARALLRAGASAMAALPGAVLDGCLAAVANGARLVRGARHRRLDHDVLFVEAAAPRPEQSLDPSGWLAHLTGRQRRCRVEATHPDLVREPYVGQVGAAMRAELERVGRGLPVAAGV